MFVWWGDELINLYNDAYRPILGGKHPAALGQPARRSCGARSGTTSARGRGGMRRNEGAYDEALLLIMERNGYHGGDLLHLLVQPGARRRAAASAASSAPTPRHRARSSASASCATLRELGRAHRATRAPPTTPARAPPRALGDEPVRPAVRAALPGRRRTRSAHAGRARRASTTRTPRRPATIALDDAAASGRSRDALRSRATGRHRSRRPTPVARCRPARGTRRPSAARSSLPLAAPAIAAARRSWSPGSARSACSTTSYRGFLELVAGQIAAAIAERRAYEEQRRRAEALAELDRAKTAFFSNVSHEFRTPLTLMLGPDRGRARAPSGALGGRERSRLVHRNALRLLKLVNTLLDFSRIEAGRVQASYRADRSRARSPRDLASAFRVGDRARRARASSSTAPPLAEPVFVDRDMWEKIVLNLLSNAFKFTFEGAIAVTPARRRRRASSSRCATPASASPSDELPRIFERFHRVEGARARTHEGSGIGLALVHELVELHGGDDRASTSALGRGTTFTVAHPARRGAPARRADRARDRRAASTRRRRAAPYVEEALRWLPDGDAGARRPARRDAGARRRRRAHPGRRRQRRHARLPARALLGAALDGRGGRRRRARRSRRSRARAARPRPHRRDDAGARRLRPAARAARRCRRTRDIPVIMLSARAGEEARVEGLRGRRRRLPGQAVLGARAARARRGAARAARALRAVEERSARRLRRALRRRRRSAIAILRGPEHRLRAGQRRVPRS